MLLRLDDWKPTSEVLYSKHSPRENHIETSRVESSRNERQSGERSFACSVGANPVLRVDTPLYELRALFLLQTIESPLDCYFYYRLRNQMDTISSLRIRIEVETRQEM